MALLRILAPALVLTASLCGNAMAASGACDPLKLFTLHTAEKNAWTSRDYPRLHDLNLEEAKYDDACAHQEKGTDRAQHLELAAGHYRDAGVVELGKQQYALAKKHLLRSNAIIRELQASGDAQRPDYLREIQELNNLSLASIRQNAK